MGTIVVYARSEMGMGKRGEVLAELDASRARRVLERLPYAAVVVDRERRVSWSNRLDPNAAGAPVIGRRAEQFVHKSGANTVVEAIERVFCSGDPVEYEVQGIGQANGESGLASLCCGTVVLLPGGEGLQACALLVAAPPRRQPLAEQALRDSEHRFRMLTEASPDTILIVDRDHRVVYLNREPPAGSGASRDDIIGRSIEELTNAGDVAITEATIERALTEGEPGIYEVQGGVSGHVYINRVMRLPGEASAPQALITATDVTEQRRSEAKRAALEAQLQQAQKLETVGQLAGGVAHDFNNVLLIIQSHLEFAMSAVQAGGDVMHELRAVAAAAERASDMTRRLLTIGRRARYEPTTFDLATFARETINLLDRMMPESIQIEFTAESEPLLVRADRPQLEQVLINICLNARDAIVDVGRIALSVGRAQSTSGVAANDWLALSVRDTGAGMDEATLAHIFEPFFTTKSPGKGTGLGLSMVHGIVAENGGRVEVNSVAGQGTKFTVLLPRVAEEPGPVALFSPSEQARSERAATILLAEDESGVRKVVVRILQRAGYAVVEAGDGRQAVDLFREHAKRIDLVLLDAVMPVLGGKDAYDEIVRIRPDVPVLFSSGYAVDVLPSSFLSSHGLNVLGKPYRPAALLAAVRQALKGSARSSRS